MWFVRSLVIGVSLLVGLVLVLPAALILAPFLGVSWLVRTLSRLGRRQRLSVPWQELVDYEPEIGWRPKPDLDVYGRADDVFHLTTDRDGWRGVVPLEEADVVVVGDSFAFGHGADDERMYAAFTGDVGIKAVGSDGYDMTHGLLWMERLAPHLQGKLVVWFVFYGNDLWENLLPAMGHYRKPFVRPIADSDDWEIATEHVGPDPWPFGGSRNYHEPLAEICCEDSELQVRVARSCGYLIQRAQRVCAETGASLAVVGIPDRVQLTRRGVAKLRRLAPKDGTVDVTLTDQMLRRACDQSGVTFVPLSEHLTARDYLIQDIHWQPSGHRKVGRILRNLWAAPGTLRSLKGEEPAKGRG